MADTNIRFYRVSTLPTSGYVTGGVYFVSSENKIYVRTDSGWEAYGASGDGSGSYVPLSRVTDSVVYGSTGIPTGDAVWKAIHSETPSAVSSSSTSMVYLYASSAHKHIINLTSGSRYYRLPSSPTDGETFEFIKPKAGCTVYISSAPSNIYNCHTFKTVLSVTLSSANKCRVTVIYSSTMAQWVFMQDEFMRVPVSPLAVGKAVYNGSSTLSLTYKSFDGTVLYGTRNSEGNFNLYLPYAWFSSESEIFCALTGVFSSSANVHYVSPCLESITSATYSSATRWCLNITLHDDSTPNDGSFHFLIYNMNKF